METRITVLETDIKNIYHVLKRQQEDTKNLTQIASNTEVMIKEMEYVRKDIEDMKTENATIKDNLAEQQLYDYKTKAETFDYYKKQITVWALIGILGLAVVGATVGYYIKDIVKGAC